MQSLTFHIRKNPSGKLATLAMVASLLFTTAACRNQTGTFGRSESSKPRARRTADPPTGFRFRDGWLLEWKTSQAELTTHYKRETRDGWVACPEKSYCYVMAFLIPDTLLPDDKESFNTWRAMTLDYFQDQFYRAEAGVPVEKFDAFEASLNAALGEPDSRSVSVVENAMGAKYDQVAESWVVGDVMVSLSKRANQVDRGSYSVAYSPIERLIPPAPPPKAPF